MDNSHNNGSNGHVSIRRTLAGKHLLVTGVTGFLAKVWVAMLLDHVPEIGRITLLIRPVKGKSASKRFEEVYQSSPVFRPLRERLGMRLHDLIEEKVVVCEGNIEQPLAGLDFSEATRLMRNVDAVVHFAGLTSFVPDPRLAVTGNVASTIHLADLAALSQTRRFVYCSTAFVAGTQDGKVQERLELGVSPNGTEFDPAAELAALRSKLAELTDRRTRTTWAMERAEELGWPNIYTFSKGLAEHLIASRPDVEATIIRPSIVECALHYPFAGWNEGINTSGPLAWLLSTGFRRFPSRAHYHFDVVPVDTIARGCTLVVAAALRGQAHEVYHLASSEINPFKFGRAIELTGLGARRTHRASTRWLDRAIMSRLDAIAVSAERPQTLGVGRLKHGLKETLSVLQKVNLKRELPPRLYERWGKSLDTQLNSLRAKTFMAGRQMASIDAMLRQYQPFIHDHDYIFLTRHVMELAAFLPEHEQRLFSFNVCEVDWHHYWLEVQMPGLEKWSIPLLQDKTVPNDPPLERKSQPSVAAPRKREARA